MIFSFLFYLVGGGGVREARFCSLFLKRFTLLSYFLNIFFTVLGARGAGPKKLLRGSAPAVYIKENLI